MPNNTKPNSKMIKTGNYIYIYNLDTLINIPVYPESILDSLQSNFQQTNALARTAPVFTYQNSGPRSMAFQFNFHREMLDDANKGGLSNAELYVGEDYIDYLIRNLQAIALPTYNISSKSVVPPMVAVRIGEGDDIFIKGVVIGGVSVGYSLPILSNGKYAQVSISFTVYETDPYDAKLVSQLGSFRGITSAFKDGQITTEG